jgi:hypothetical protein
LESAKPVKKSSSATLSEDRRSEGKGPTTHVCLWGSAAMSCIAPRCCGCSHWNACAGLVWPHCTRRTHAPRHVARCLPRAALQQRGALRATCPWRVAFAARRASCCMPRLLMAPEYLTRSAESARMTCPSISTHYPGTHGTHYPGTHGTHYPSTHGTHYPGTHTSGLPSRDRDSWL